jgi:hypothetical protein
MAARVLNKKRVMRPAAKKAVWSAKYVHNFLDAGTVNVKGSTNNGIKAFSFNVISPLQQSRERNKAYQYFTID